MSKRSTFVIKPFLTMLNLEVDRISLQQLEYEMVCTNHPVKYFFLKWDIVVTLTSLTQIFNSSKPVIKYFHIFKNTTIYSFMIHLKTKRHNWFTYIMFTNPRKTHPERILRIMTKWLIHICKHMEIDPLVIIVI